MREAIIALVTANLAAGAAILIVALLRRPVRAGFGARIGYLMWWLVPLAVAASLAPPRVSAIAPLPIAPAAMVHAAEQALASVWTAAPGPGGAITAALWLIGALAMTGWLTLRQLHFASAHRRGEAGPAVLGVIRPRIIVPNDFETRFDHRERAMVLAHEGVHLARSDARINALVALARCLCWFNPLIHLGAQLMRIDQEMACDAAVVAHHPRARGAYAQALLKAQLTARPLPLGCYWRAEAQHPLMVRMAMLSARLPTTGRQIAGASTIAAICAAGGYAAWAVAPVAAPVAAASYAYVEEALAPEPEAEAPPPPIVRLAPAPVFEAAPIEPDAPGVHIDPVRISGVVVRTDFTKANDAIWVYGSGYRADGTTIDQQLWRLAGTVEPKAETRAAPTHTKVIARSYGTLENGHLGAPLVDQPDCSLATSHNTGCLESDLSPSPPLPPTEADIRIALADTVARRYQTDAMMPEE